MSANGVAEAHVSLCHSGSLVYINSKTVLVGLLRTTPTFFRGPKEPLQGYPDTTFLD